MKMKIATSAMQAIFVAVLFSALTTPATDWYVSHNGVAPFDGLSWETAKTNLQSAINAAGDSDTIWIDSGFICDTGVTTNSPQGESDAPARIVINKSLTIRGRSGTWRENPPVICGVHAPTDSGAGEGAMRCAIVIGARNKVTLIGIQFDGGATKVTGYADGNGGGAGLRGNSAANTVATNCLFSGNVANNGGGVHLVTAIDCMISNNTALVQGGGANRSILTDCSVLCNRSKSTIYYGGGAADKRTVATNCLFADNESPNGGGVANGTFVGCIISNNTATHFGGGAKDATLVSCLVFNNIARRGGGVNGGTVSNCVIACNVATGDGTDGGGGIHSLWGTCYDCTVSNNVAPVYGGIYSNFRNDLYNFVIVNNAATNGMCGGVGMADLHNCVVRGNSATDRAGGTYDCNLFDCIVTENSAGENGGGCYGDSKNAKILVGSIVVSNTCAGSGGGCYGSTLTNCTVALNTALSAKYPNLNGGGGIANGSAVKCTISNNTCASWYGGGTFSASTVNCLIVGNVCTYEDHRNNRGGGGVYAGTHCNTLVVGNTAFSGGGGATGGKFYNCTIASNTNLSSQAALSGGSYNAVFVNSICFDNTDSASGANDSFAAATNSCAAAVSDILSKGPGNITDDPRLIKDGSDRYLPGGGSPAKHRGMVFAWMTDPFDIRSKALNNYPRIIGSKPDMGCFEVPVYHTILLTR